MDIVLGGLAFAVLIVAHVLAVVAGRSWTDCATVEINI